MHERDVIERILKQVTHDGQCWIVSGWSDGKGYRNVSIDGKTCKTHRVLFEWFWRRKLRRDIQLDHKCCNRSCCNPLHLQPVKNKKNSQLRSKRRKKMLDGNIMDEIHAAAAQGKDTLAPVKKPSLSEPYWKDQSWFVEAQK